MLQFYLYKLINMNILDIMLILDLIHFNQYICLFFNTKTIWGMDYFIFQGFLGSLLCSCELFHFVTCQIHLGITHIFDSCHVSFLMG